MVSCQKESCAFKCRDAVSEGILTASGCGGVRYHTGDRFAAGPLRLQTDPRLLLPAGRNRVGWEIPVMSLHMQPGGEAVVEAVVDGLYVKI